MVKDVVTDIYRGRRYDEGRAAEKRQDFSSRKSDMERGREMIRGRKRCVDGGHWKGMEGKVGIWGLGKKEIFYRRGSKQIR